jgi:hypothetical protein
MKVFDDPEVVALPAPEPKYELFDEVFEFPAPEPKNELP